MFITLEGPDGSGKTTMMNRITQYLEEKGIDFIVTREPGGTQIGEEIRNIILDAKNKNMASETEALLYAASRAQHVHEKINPALKEGKIVLCERFILSSLAYQGIGRKLGIEEVYMINHFAIKGVKPDLTLFFRIDPAVSLNRKVEKGGDRLEQEGIQFHQQVYNGYMKLLELYPENIRVIDASKSKEDVFRQCISSIEEILKRRNKI
ncbi:MAG: dTMP kinase [Tissierellia bacterium]|nr:dTMP kinase [Tissierellia bacterium]